MVARDQAYKLRDLVRQMAPQNAGNVDDFFTDDEGTGIAASSLQATEKLDVSTVDAAL